MTFSSLGPRSWMAPRIVYGNRSFSGPMQFPAPLPAPLSGLYTIVVPDVGWTPRQFRLLYLGESSNIKERATEQHEKYDDWLREAGGRPLYIGYSTTVGMTDQQRRDEECRLINLCNPPCNVRKSSFWDEVAAHWGKSL
jgi:hypothetical protein